MWSVSVPVWNVYFEAKMNFCGIGLYRCTKVS